MKQQFYICKHCGNIVAFVKNSGVPLVCCGEKMHLIEANTVDASVEKHVPVITKENGNVIVTVGSAAHPMEDAHHIEWISIETKEGNQRKELTGNKAKACFALCEGDEVLHAYSYCNLHGLWQS